MEEIKREKTLEELKKEYEDIENAYNSLKATIKKKEAEENERKRAQLTLEKENRKKTIEEKEKELITLVHKYIEDYGSYEFYRSFDNKDKFTNIDKDIFSYLHRLFF